jgi:hypothetical protein
VTISKSTDATQVQLYPPRRMAPFYPEDAYSLSKQCVIISSPLDRRADPCRIAELQSDSIVRRYPSMRIVTLRFHGVTPDHMCTQRRLHERQGSWKDLWRWVSVVSSFTSCIIVKWTCKPPRYIAQLHSSTLVGVSLSAWSFVSAGRCRRNWSNPLLMPSCTIMAALRASVLWTAKEVSVNVPAEDGRHTC